MQISQNLPQFEKFPALFLTSGEYEAHFYVASEGKMTLNEKLKMPPRDEAKEKQAFTGRKSGMQDLSSYSHKGRYIEDLKLRFSRKVHQIIRRILEDNSKMEEIYVFAPKFMMARIIANLSQSEKKKIRMQFYKEYTKENPTLLLKIFQKEIEKIQKEAMRDQRKQMLP